MSTNVCMFTGRLVKKPEVRKTPEDVSVSNFTLAVEQRRFNKTSKEWVSDVQFLDFEIWDSGADVFSNRFDKGDLVIVRAMARVNKWKDKETDKEQRVVRFRVDEFDGLSRNRSQNATAQAAQEPVAAGVDSGDTSVPF